MCYSVLVEQDLKALERHFKALVDWPAFSRYQRLSEAHPKTYKPLSSNPRIFPNYFAPIIVCKDGRRSILPMRYRLRPAGSDKEVPNKYNLYNARLDSLSSRSTWRRLLGHQHGLLAYRAFFEWVEDKRHRKRVIEFSPQDNAHAWLVSPVLYDIWVSADRSRGFASFAMITQEPFADVAQAGHDRSPIILPESLWDPWLSPSGTPTKQIIEQLLQKVVHGR